MILTPFDYPSMVEGLNQQQIRLYERYRDLYYHLLAGQDQQLLLLTQEVIDGAVSAHPGKFRSDAAHFLAVNIREMIVRPCFLRGPRRDDDTPVYAVGPDVAHRMIEHTVGLIVRDLVERKPDGPWSAHDVLRAIDRQWEPLNAIFAWA